MRGASRGPARARGACKRAIAIGEKIGLYKDWPMSKGCIIPYVPVCVPAMVKGQG